VHMKGPLRTCCLMQRIHVLRTNYNAIAQRLFQLGKGQMTWVRFATRSDGTTPRVETPYQLWILFKSFRSGKLIEPILIPQSARTAESRDTALSADPRSG